MIKKITPLAILALTACPMAFSNINLLDNGDYSYNPGWVVGANLISYFPVWTYNGWAELEYEAQVEASGDGFIFKGWNDDASDWIEEYLLQSFKASPYSFNPEQGPTAFNTGDVIVFKGKARATKTGTDTSDMIVRVFLKTLGWLNDQSHQVLTEYSEFKNLGSTLEDFELSITFPDVVEMDNPQLVQVGFEISTEWDGAAYDYAEIYYQDLEAYVVTAEPTTWAGLPIDENGFADSGSWLGQIYVRNAPWVWLAEHDKYVYAEESGISETGGWVFVPAP